jgi:hypothetical protein
MRVRGGLEGDGMADVEAQLDEAVKSVRQGALPWSVCDKPLDVLKERVRPLFEQHQETWERDKAKVLRMCRYIGNMAAILAEFRNPAVEDPATGRNIPDECVYLAAWAVRIACPDEGEIVIRGIRCSILGIPEGKLYEDVKKAFQAIGAS